MGVIGSLWVRARRKWNVSFGAGNTELSSINPFKHICKHEHLRADRSVVVSLALHARGRGFNPHFVHYFFAIFVGSVGIWRTKRDEAR
jgi:hypothetical protein